MTNHNSGELTNKQRAFAEEYLIDLNATQAAIRAGYSKNSASVIGFENLRKPKIAAAIAEAREEQAKRTEITVDSVLNRLVEDRELARSLGKPSAAVRADELLGKHVGMFNKEQIDHTIKGPLVIIRGADKPAKDEEPDQASGD